MLEQERGGAGEGWGGWGACDGYRYQTTCLGLRWVGIWGAVVVVWEGRQVLSGGGGSP